MTQPENFSELASYRRCVERVRARWPAFIEKRRARLAQQERHGVAAEKVAENILEDLFTEVLDWQISDLNNQVEYADLLLTSLGIKYLLVEVKRPGTLVWNRRAVEQALGQARRYADDQKVKCIAVSDGSMLYVADIVHGGTKDRICVSLDRTDAPEALWWLSVQGVYREIAPALQPVFVLPDVQVTTSSELSSVGHADLVHPKYHLPARCFAYVGNATDQTTWKLPYRLDNGCVDTKRLPKAIGAILSNYRGVKVHGIPEAAIPDVLVRLAKAASSTGKLPLHGGEAALAYEQLVAVLDQLGRLEELKQSE